MSPKRVLLAVASLAFLGVGELPAETQSATAPDSSLPITDMRELLRNLPQEFEKFARLHPLPPQTRALKFTGRTAGEETGCLDDMPVQDDWEDASGSWKTVVGAAAICALSAAIERLSSRER